MEVVFTSVTGQPHPNDMLLSLECNGISTSFDMDTNTYFLVHKHSSEEFDTIMLVLMEYHNMVYLNCVSGSGFAYVLDACKQAGYDDNYLIVVTPTRFSYSKQDI